MSDMKQLFCLMLVVLVSITGCSVKRAVLGEVVKKNLVCTDEVSCKNALAEDCPNGGILYGVVPAIVVQYSCKP